jgi:hypothetical protein
LLQCMHESGLVPSRHFCALCVWPVPVEADTSRRTYPRQSVEADEKAVKRYGGFDPGCVKTPSGGVF